MEDKPSDSTRTPTKGHLRKQRYDERMLYTTQADGTRVQTHWRMDVYVTPKQRERLSEIADDVDRKRLMGRVLAHYDKKAELPSSLPKASDLRWRSLAQELFDMFRSSDQVDTLLVHQLARRVDEFIADVEPD